MSIQEISYIFVGIFIGMLIGYLIAKIYYWINISKSRKIAVEQSKAVILGHVNEKIAPILPNFPYNFSDLTFIGKGIDYLVFDGLAEGNLKQIVFLEIKTGKSQLNNNEKQIKNNIEKGNIKYEVMKI